MGKPLHYQPEDFKLARKDDPDYFAGEFTFISDDGYVVANYFHQKGNCEVRGMVGQDDIINIQYPFANAKGDTPEPKPETILESIIKSLATGEY